VGSLFTTRFNSEEYYCYSLLTEYIYMFCMGQTKNNLYSPIDYYREGDIYWAVRTESLLRQSMFGTVKKVKFTLVQALRLCTCRAAHRGSRGIALLFHEHGIRRGWGISVTPRPLFTPEKDPVPIVPEARWATGLVWTGAENLAPPHRD